MIYLVLEDLHMLLYCFMLCVFILFCVFVIDRSVCVM